MTRMLQQKGQWGGAKRGGSSDSSLHFALFKTEVVEFGCFFAGFLQDEENGDLTLQDEEGTPSGSPDLPRYAPQCQWAPLSDLDPDTLTFSGGAPIQLHTVPVGLLLRIPHFYVCTRCGKVFWEGTHFTRLLSMFEDVLHITGAEPAASTAAQHD